MPDRMNEKTKIPDGHALAAQTALGAATMTDAGRAMLQGTDIDQAFNDTRSDRAVQVFSKGYAVGPASRFWRWVVRGILVALAMSPLPVGAFSADGIHSGMTLEEIKETPMFSRKKVEYLWDEGNIQWFKVDAYTYFFFCNGKLITYKKDFKNFIEFYSAISSLKGIEMRKERYNHEIGVINNGKTYYDNLYTWNEGEDGFLFSFFSKIPVAAESIESVGWISKNISFGYGRPIEVYGYSHRCAD